MSGRKERKKEKVKKEKEKKEKSNIYFTNKCI